MYIFTPTLQRTFGILQFSGQLLGKTDQRFLENSFKLFRDCLGIRTVLTASQFLGQVRESEECEGSCALVASKPNLED